MYESKLVAAVKVNGRVLREDKEKVFIPFGSEYSLYLKNLNSIRAKVRIEIDGKDIGDGRSFIVGVNESIDIERFITNNNLSEGRRFKFIERTQKIENGPRGVRAEDGLIRIEFEFEKVWRQPVGVAYDLLARDRYTNETPVWKYRSKSISSDNFEVQDADLLNNAVDTPKSFSHRVVSSSTSARKNEVGITVGGSVSTQQFTTVNDFISDGVKHVMVFQVFGETENGDIQKPFYSREKVKCETCGTVNKAGSKFCAECGTGLLQP